MTPPAAGKRIVLTTFGWLGDFYPYLVLGQGLQARGHRVVLATSTTHQERVRLAGLEFHPVRPDLPSAAEAREVVRRAMDPRSGNDYLMRVMLMPTLGQQYEDLSAATRGRTC